MSAKDVISVLSTASADSARLRRSIEGMSHLSEQERLCLEGYALLLKGNIQEGEALLRSSSVGEDEIVATISGAVLKGLERMRSHPSGEAEGDHSTRVQVSLAHQHLVATCIEVAERADTHVLACMLSSIVRCGMALKLLDPHADLSKGLLSPLLRLKGRSVGPVLAPDLIRLANWLKDHAHPSEQGELDSLVEHLKHESKT